MSSAPPSTYLINLAPQGVCPDPQLSWPDTGPGFYEIIATSVFVTGGGNPLSQKLIKKIRTTVNGKRYEVSDTMRTTKNGRIAIRQKKGPPE